MSPFCDKGLITSLVDFDFLSFFFFFLPVFLSSGAVMFQKSPEVYIYISDIYGNGLQQEQFPFYN